MNLFWIFLDFLAFLCLWYFFRKREQRLLDTLQKMLEQAQSGKLEVDRFDETKLSSVENSLKRYLDDTSLVLEHQRGQKAKIQMLISDISHQTLTPISNIKLYAELLAEQRSNREIDVIREQTEKLDFLIHALVKLSRLESGILSMHAQENKVALLLESMREQYEKKAEEKKLLFALEGTDAVAVFDLKWTAEALGNIVENAIKYTDFGGNVTICVKKYSFFVRIDVADDGIGIDEREQNKIFSRFYRSLDVREKPGVGIGLYLAREIVQEQKGYLKVSSQKGKGSTFSVFLPLSQSSSKELK